MIPSAPALPAQQDRVRQLAPAVPVRALRVRVLPVPALRVRVLLVPEVRAETVLLRA